MFCSTALPKTQHSFGTQSRECVCVLKLQRQGLQLPVRANPADELHANQTRTASIRISRPALVLVALGVFFGLMQDSKHQGGHCHVTQPPSKFYTLVKHYFNDSDLITQGEKDDRLIKDLSDNTDVKVHLHYSISPLTCFAKSCFRYILVNNYAHSSTNPLMSELNKAELLRIVIAGIFM